MQDARGFLPIHIAAVQGEPALDSVKILLQADPANACVPSDHGLLPLWYAISANTQVCGTHSEDHMQLVQIVLQAYPDIVSTPDEKFGNIALHYAAEMNAGIEVVQLLLEECGAILLLLEKNAAAVSSSNKMGQLPLHLTAAGYSEEKGLPSEEKAKKQMQMVEHLVQAHPAAVSVRDVNDHMPMHRACLIVRPTLS